MGAPPSVVITSVTWRAASAGIVTGIILALARIAGETAPLLFTALNNNSWFSANLMGGIANLPVMIYQFALSPYPNWQGLAWAGALLITGTILALSIIARLVIKPQRSPPPLTDDVRPTDEDMTMNAASALTTGITGREAPAPARAVRIAVKDLNFYYGSFHGLKNVNLNFYDRQVTALIAPRAAGSRPCCGPSTASTACTRSSAPRGRSSSTARTSSTPAST